MSVSSAKKKQVAERAKFLCEYCFSPRRFSPDSFSIEHVQPKSKNSSDELENLAFAYQGCNGFKGNKTFAVDLAGEKKSRFIIREKMFGKSTLRRTKVSRNLSA